MTHLRVFLFCLLALLLAPVLAAAKLEAPNLSLNVYQRIFPSSKEARISLSTYNLRSVTFTAYPVKIETLIPNTTVLDAGNSAKNPQSVLGRLKVMKLARPAATWSEPVKHFYPNDWQNQSVKLPVLPHGVYVIQARGGGVTQRTWLAISSRALITKRSPDVIKTWLVSADGRHPVAGAPVVLYGPKGRLQEVKTAADGLATFNIPSTSGALWVAARDAEPAFGRAPEPWKERPYRVYVYTDRPIYRPGQEVHFHGTVRAQNRGAYSLPTEKSVTVRIKSRGDAIIYEEKLPLNSWGSFTGTFTLAPEPPLGSYSLVVSLPGDFREYASFEVEAYRKPEFTTTVTMPAEHQLGGKTVPVKITATYLFGSPVSGGKVSYNVSFSQVSDAVPTRIRTAAGLGSAALADIEEDFSGTGRLDANGVLELQIPTRVVNMDRGLYVSATVTDQAQRSNEGTGNMLLTGALFNLDLLTDSYRYQPGDNVQVTVKTNDYDNKPVAVAVKVTLVETREDREKHTITERTERAVSTGADGVETVTFTVQRPGYYRVEAVALDAERNPIFAETEFNVSVKKEAAPTYPLLDMTPNKVNYAPGDTARLRIRTSLTGNWALLTLEGERLYLARVIKLEKKEFAIDLPVLADYQPGVDVRLTTVQNGQLRVAYANLIVPRTGKKLTVTLTPEKTSYQPGEQATYTLTTTDSAGRGVPAEVSLAVVDKALYEIRPDGTRAPFTVFWSAQPNRTETDFSLSAAYPGGAYQQLARAKTPIPAMVSRSGKFQNGYVDDLLFDGPVRVRKQFEDTAYWAGSVMTDNNGHGTVTFTLPDNLTTWRLTARGVTPVTQAGEGRSEVTVSAPLMVRLALPRFYVKGDKATATALVHNYTGMAREVRVRLSSEGMQITGAAEQVVNVPAVGIARVTWQVTAAGITGQAEDSARFLVQADGGEGARDAMESTVPVHPDAVRRVDAAAGLTDTGTSVTLTLPAQALPGSASAQLSLSPSLAGPIFEALDYLSKYPYGGAEQTMDRFLPDLIAQRTLRELGVTRPEPEKLQRYINFGLQKLLRFQHDDGGWNWWENDESDPYMTAYVVYGLAMTRDAGYPQAAAALPRGVEYLRDHLTDEQPRDVEAYFLFALVTANVWSDDEERSDALKIAKLLYQDREKLDLFSRASLALALQRMSGWAHPPQDFAAMALKMADELENARESLGTGVYWTAHASEECSWQDSNVEVTAQVMQSLLAIKPKSEYIVSTVRWLMTARNGDHWNSTKDTAAAVLALTSYLKQAKELAPNYTVIVTANGHEAGRYKAATAQALAEPMRSDIPATMLVPGENTIRLEKAGAGNLYWTARLNYMLPVAGLQPLTKGIAIKREYSIATDNPLTAGQQPSGSLIGVTVHITADQSLRYAVLEEPIPAGCELVSNGEGTDLCDNVDEWDNRIVYYFDYLPRGESTVTYWLRTESPGQYNIPPATGSLLYFPEVRGEGPVGQMRVVE